MKLHIVVVAYQRAIPLRMLIDCFILQTYKNWQMTIFHDGPATEDIKNVMSGYSNESRITFIDSSDSVGNHGFLIRKAMLDIINGDKGDYLLNTNDDNYYAPCFVEYMLAKAGNDIGIVYCDTVHSHFGYDLQSTALKLNHVDMGAFIVKLDLAKAIGFNHNVYAYDGLFAEELDDACRRTGLKTIHISKPLFVHN